MPGKDDTNVEHKIKKPVEADGAGDVKQKAAGFYAPGCAFKNARLNREYLFQIAFSETPFEIGIAPPCSAAAAWCVDQHDQGYERNYPDLGRTEFRPTGILGHSTMMCISLDKILSRT